MGGAAAGSDAADSRGGAVADTADGTSSIGSEMSVVGRRMSERPSSCWGRLSLTCGCLGLDTDHHGGARHNEDSRLHRVKILCGCNLQTLADVKWTNKEPGETS